MSRRIGLRILATSALAMGFQILLASTAMADTCHVTITATATCRVDGTAVIEYTATASEPNSELQVKFNNVVIASGATDFLSGSFPAPSESSVTVTAFAAGTYAAGSIPGGQSASTTVAIPTDCASGLGRFTGGGSQIHLGNVRVTRGLTIHCDLLLSNNLEVNWQGHQFHMTEHLTTVQCSDDPNIIQAPPAAPLDTLIGIGTGRYDNVDGFTILFTLVDAGEPGTADKAALKIFETANPANVVLNVPLQLLSGGNLQAHYDQPHK